MTDTEIKMLWIYCQEIWGSTFQVAEDANRRSIKLAAWRDCLSDLDADLVRRALVGDASHFALTPPEIRATALDRLRVERGDPPVPNVDQALAEIHRLISHFGYTRENEALEAAAAFHPALGQAVRSLGWRDICMDENPAVFRGQFRVIYESARNRVERETTIPAPALAARLGS